jgi:hypothetical protein
MWSTAYQCLKARKGSLPARAALFNAPLLRCAALARIRMRQLLDRRNILGKKEVFMKGAIRLGLILGCLLVTIVTSGARAEEAILALSGKVRSGEVALTRHEIAKLPQRTLTEQPTSFPEPVAFKGPSLSDVLKLAGATGGNITVTAADDYTVDIGADEIKTFDPILAIEKDGVRMAPDDFGPYFIMWPFKENPEIDNETFQAKAVWNVVKIEVK